jgi:hypothetical protein
MGTVFAILFLAAPIVALMTGAFFFMAPRLRMAQSSTAQRKTFPAPRDVLER